MSCDSFLWQILYLEGKWSCLPRLLGLIEPARLRSLMPLHKTTIRNEQVRIFFEMYAV